MDGYSLGLILRQLIAAGIPLRAIVGLAVLGAAILGAFKAAKGIGAFAASMLASRDASIAQNSQVIASMVSQTMQRVAEQDARRAVFEAEQAKFMAQMSAQIDSSLFEAREARKEMHQRFNKVQEDVTTIRGAVS